MIIRLNPTEVNFAFAAVKSFGASITISGNFILTAKISIKSNDLDFRRKDQFDKLASDNNNNKQNMPLPYTTNFLSLNLMNSATVHKIYIRIKHISWASYHMYK